MRGAVATNAGVWQAIATISLPCRALFEIPSAIRIAIASGRYEGYVALGCVIRGETTHYDYVCAESASGLNRLALDHMAAIGYGILTTENKEQAFVRAATTQGNKGRDAVEAALRILALKKEMGITMSGQARSSCH